MPHSIRLASLISAFLLVVPAGCGDGKDDSGSDGDGTGGDGTASSGDAGGGDMTGTGSSSTGGAQCGPDEVPDGEDCECDEQCASNVCYSVPLLGAKCGECKTDADCPDGGCTPPNPLAGDGSFCNMGEMGDGCDDDASCQDGLTCEELINIGGGAFIVSGCSPCATDADCEAGQLCSPEIDVANFEGQWWCVDEGSVENGKACDHEGNGDMACASGICAVADIPGIVQIGMCGDCRTDDDCPAEETCVEPAIDINTLEVMPSYCDDGSTGTGSGTDSGTDSGTGTGTDTGTGTATTSGSGS